MPLSLTSCSDRDKQSVLLKLRERIKTPVVQWHALLMCHCHLPSEVLKCVIEVEGKNEDTSSSVACIINVPLSLTSCRERWTKCVIEVEGKNEDTSSSVTCIIDVPLSLTLFSDRDTQVCY